MARLLIVEDHAETLAMLVRLLTAEGHEVQSASRASTARRHMAEEDYDVVLLDWMLVDGSGIDLCRELRERGDQTPVLVLTARGEVEDRVTGLDAGADDYLKKPFAPKELLARTRALLRRGTKVRLPRVVRVGEAEVDLSARKVRVEGHPVPLTARELAILEILLRRKGRAVSRADIIESAWGADVLGAEASLEVLVSRLRKKLAPSGGPSPIETLRGFGYSIP